MHRVIFACVHNAGRSQMAAAFYNQLADRSKAEAISAGTEPGLRVHPRGSDGDARGGNRPQQRRTLQKLTLELANEASLLVTMGCGDECPYVPRIAP